MTDSLADRWTTVTGELPPRARLLAVSKGHPAASIRAVASLGQQAFGESRLQEAVEKQALLSDLPLQWHFIGRLQRNKVRGVVKSFSVIHSVDSFALAERVSRIAVEEGCCPDVLLQVRFREDPTKGGMEPSELVSAWPQLRALPSLRLTGLMTMAPLGLEGEERQTLFLECRSLADQLGLPDCSMGMSGDWTEAVAAGSTWLRLGSAVFGQRDVPKPGAG
ncbi:MAG: YggS family pyridoxal phosphate-dependent enzyme [Parasynechococcus sp.]|uniref:YggS family pyridoxal phosphate-dependent enzyme n=1 Tax=Parasynechococcus sp. TaxID=3101203 RepID=UPI00230978CD|nr:YggS family pyridoxal phosphate-dependent enzyme [Synechococcus sp. AH-601-J22]